MSKFKSIQTAYSPLKKKNIPLWVLNTTANTVIHYDAETHTESIKTYYSDSVRYHLSFSVSHYSDRLRRLVNDGTIIDYLDDLELKVADAIDRQIQLWKESDKEYLIAVDKGDIQTAARLENCLVYMAREAVFDCMVYICFWTAVPVRGTAVIYIFLSPFRNSLFIFLVINLSPSK